ELAGRDSETGARYEFRAHDLRHSFQLFFSSRRRHTRSKRDWSSDVCSSDLRKVMVPMRDGIRLSTNIYRPKTDKKVPVIFSRTRSEERRVGKEWRWRRSTRKKYKERDR